MSSSQSCKSCLSQDAVKMLRVLEEHFDATVVSAIQIADQVGLKPEWRREHRRREVRFLATELRNAGNRVCANGNGYWLARSQAEYEQYLDACNRRAVLEFVATRKAREMTRDDNRGQQVLFDTRPARQGAFA